MNWQQSLYGDFLAKYCKYTKNLNYKAVDTKESSASSPVLAR